MSMAKSTIKFTIIVLIVAGTFLLVKYLKEHKPEIGRAPKPKTSYLVEVENVEIISEPLVMETMGTVIPVRETTIKPRVAGTVVKVADQFRPGGYFAQGEVILEIDPADYKLAVEAGKAQLATSQAAYLLEMGKQEVAAREWDMVSKGRKFTQQEKDLALRQPQLNQAKAAVDSARISLENSQLSLSRTTISAPYNSIVLTKNVELGTNVSTQESLLSLVDVDRFWIEVSIPQDELNWVVVPHLDDAEGSKAVISYGSGDTVEGTVVSLLSDLEEKGRMARVLVEVKDPFGLQSQSGRLPLLLGNYVKVNIYGKPLNNVVRIPRTAFRDGGNVWIASETGEQTTLEIREVKTIWRDEDTVVVSSGLLAGEKLITSAIASPIEGMLLRVSDEPAKTE